jgi:hypothetical protein
MDKIGAAPAAGVTIPLRAGFVTVNKGLATAVCGDANSEQKMASNNSLVFAAFLTRESIN